MYPSTVGRAGVDQGPDFAHVLWVSISRHYGGSQGQFARAAGVAESSVSRWLSGVIPSRNNIRKIAPFVLDAKGRPIPATRLENLAIPSPGADGGRTVYLETTVDMHPLAEEVNRLLAEGVMPTKVREALVSLLDSLLAPYRRYLKGRRAS